MTTNWQELGFQVKIPRRRSSDFGLCCDPLLYFVSRRLGVVPRFDSSDALNRGTWFHRRFHTTAPNLVAQLEGRKTELRGACRDLGCDHLPVLAREQRDFDTACAWYDAASTVPFKDQRLDFFGTLPEWLARFEIVGPEIWIETPDDIAQLDMVLLDLERNEAWIADIKTTSSSPRERLARCTIELQTLHYLNVANSRWTELRGARWTALPLAGMIHIAVQKCPLEFGTLDRNFREYAHELKSGPRKGQIEMRREYEGEPRYENYLRRSQEWYTATGPYEHLAGARQDDPPVNISRTPLSLVLDRRHMAAYEYWCLRLDDLRLRAPDLHRFPPGPSAMVFNTPYAPFYLTEPEQWPSVMQQEGFHFADRDIR